MKQIQKKPLLIRNAIAQQFKAAANTLTIQEWNEVINILKQQANYNTAYLEELHRLLFFNYDSDTSGFLEFIDNIEEGILPYIFSQIEILQNTIGSFSYYGQQTPNGDSKNNDLWFKSTGDYVAPVAILSGGRFSPQSYANTLQGGAFDSGEFSQTVTGGVF
jgi:hypothetical protein